jgi:hypothetical protein
MIERVIALVALTAWAVWAFVRYNAGWGDDLAALWFAGHFAAQGQFELIYSAPPDFFGGTPSEWLPLLDALSVDSANAAFPYIYLPLWAGLMAPLTQLISIESFFTVSLILNIVTLAGCVLLAEKVARPPNMPYLGFIAWGIAALTLSLSASVAVMLLQPTIAVVALVLGCFAVLPRRPFIAGFLLALATAIKLSPVVFVLLLLHARARLALLGFAMGLLFLGTVSVALMGGPLHQDFLAQLGRAKASAVWAVLNPSLRVLLEYLAGQIGWLPQVTINPEGTALLRPDPVIGRLVAAIAVAIALPAVWLVWSRPGAQARTLGLLGMSLGIAVFGPLSWQHYFLLPLLILPALTHRFSPRATLISLLVFLACNSITLNELLASSGISTTSGAFLATYTAVFVACWLVALTLTLISLRAIAPDRDA